MTDTRSTYYVDTCGNWMLNAFFDEELRLLESRHREYLALFMNAYCDSNADLIGVVPTVTREIERLPGFYQELRHASEIGEPLPIGSDGLVADSESLKQQFDVFSKHFAVYPADVLRFVRFHTHDHVASGFFGATGRKEKTPGVPDFIEEFLSASTTRLELVAANSDVVSVKQAFAIFQRGFTYARAATAANAYYLTHPIRWSCAGFGKPVSRTPAFAHILGGIVAAVIKDGLITSASDLYLRLRDLRASSGDWRPEVLRLERAVAEATSAAEREEMVKKLERHLVKTAAGWFGGQLTPEAGRALNTIVGALVAGAVKLLYGDTAAALASGAAITGALTLYATPVEVGPHMGRLLRKHVTYALPNVTQSCGGCGTPLTVFADSAACPVCQLPRSQ